MRHADIFIADYAFRRFLRAYAIFSRYQICFRYAPLLPEYICLLVISLIIYADTRYYFQSPCQMFSPPPPDIIYVMIPAIYADACWRFVYHGYGLMFYSLCRMRLLRDMHTMPPDILFYRRATGAPYALR